MHVQGGHFLQEDIAHFDAPFFNFSSELAAVSIFSVLSLYFILISNVNCFPFVRVNGVSS